MQIRVAMPKEVQPMQPMQMTTTRLRLQHPRTMMLREEPSLFFPEAAF
jgi:hypothetical protein